MSSLVTKESHAIETCIQVSGTVLALSGPDSSAFHDHAKLVEVSRFGCCFG